MYMYYIYVYNCIYIHTVYTYMRCPPSPPLPSPPLPSPPLPSPPYPTLPYPIKARNQVSTSWKFKFQLFLCAVRYYGVLRWNANLRCLRTIMLLSWLKFELLLQYEWLGVPFKFQTPAGKQIDIRIWTGYWRVMPCRWPTFEFHVLLACGV